MRRAALFFTALALGLLAAGCVAEGMPSSAGTEAQPPPTAQPTPFPPRQAAELGADAFAFALELEGAVFTLPFAAWELETEGWAPLAELEGLVLAPWQGCTVDWEKAGRRVEAFLLNTGEEPLAAGLCAVGQLQVRAGEGAAALLVPGGVGLGSVREAALEALGPPDDTEGRLTAEVLDYTAGQHAQIRLELDEGGRVCGLLVKNYVVLDEAFGEIAWPAEVLAWQGPEAVPESGEAWQEYALAYGGGLYRLPVPVKALLEDGWRFRDGADAQKEVAAGGFAVAVYLQKGAQVARVNLENYSDTAQPRTACFVTLLESSQSGPLVEFCLAGGIGWEASSADVLAAYGEGYILTRSGGRTRVLYRGEAGRMRFDFSDYGGEHERLEYMQIQVNG